MSEQITLHYQCRLCGKQLDRGIHLGPPSPGTIVTEPLPTVSTCHEDYFTNYVKAYHGEEDFLVKIPETRRVLALMEAVRESARTGKSVDFE